MPDRDKHGMWTLKDDAVASKNSDLYWDDDTEWVWELCLKNGVGLCGVLG